jgi:hypothetical protein
LPHLCGIFFLEAPNFCQKQRSNFVLLTSLNPVVGCTARGEKVVLTVFLEVQGVVGRGPCSTCQRGSQQRQRQQQPRGRRHSLAQHAETCFARCRLQCHFDAVWRGARILLITTADTVSLKQSGANEKLPRAIAAWLRVIVANCRFGPCCSHRSHTQQLLLCAAGGDKFSPETTVL